MPSMERASHELFLRAQILANVRVLRPGYADKLELVTSKQPSGDPTGVSGHEFQFSAAIVASQVVLMGASGPACTSHVGDSRCWVKNCDKGSRTSALEALLVKTEVDMNNKFNIGPFKNPPPYESAAGASTTENKYSEGAESLI